jgi:hypothetical protein
MYESAVLSLPPVIRENQDLYRCKIPIGHRKTCPCPSNHLSCLTAKEWIKCQLGVWQFTYEGRDIRDKNVHPATFPIALSKGLSVYLPMKANWYLIRLLGVEQL